MGPRFARAVGALIAIVLALCADGRVARADTAASDGAIALLPLDADQRLELYGQPVASAVALALSAGGVDVVVVGPKMAVPERARLIVDGTIAAGKADAVVLSVRIRDPRNGTVLDTLHATAQSLATIDRAAAELSARVLPAVHAQLAALRTAAAPEHPAVVVAHPAAATPTSPVTRAYMLGIGGTVSPALQAALADVAPAWSRRVGREPIRTTADTLDALHASTTLAAHHADLGVALEVLDLSAEAGAVPIARARVRVRIADSTHVLFDRVVVTDTVVGERGMTGEALAARVATAILEIVDPHLRRAASAWSAR